MYSIIAGTILLAIFRAFIPNHWLPLVAIAKVEKWKQTDLMIIASITACAHILGTVLLGVAFGIVGSKLAQQYENSVHIIAPLLLIIFGVIYCIIPFFNFQKKDKMPMETDNRTKTKWALIFSIMMFLSPCLEVQSLFIAAGALGMENIFFLGQVYAVVSLAGIMTLTHFAYKGVTFLDTDFMKRNAKRIAGIVLIIVGIVTFFVH